MPDWAAWIRARLGPLPLRPQRAAEIITELAAHLEESCQERVRTGVPEEKARAATLAEVTDWVELRRQIIQAEKEGIGVRIRKLWLPGLFTCALALSLGLYVNLARTYMRFPWNPEEFPSPFYLLVLFALPPVGALGACVSRRAGGSPADRILAALFPVIARTFAILLTMPFAWWTGNLKHYMRIMPNGVAVDFLRWGLLPGLALLLGTLPFLKPATHEVPPIAVTR